MNTAMILFVFTQSVRDAEIDLFATMFPRDMS